MSAAAQAAHAAATAPSAARAAAAAPAPASTPPARAHVLVVDDDADLLRLLTIRLQAGHYRVSAVASAEEALARMAVELPDVLISDVRLPGRDGLALFDEVRGQHAGLPVILLTAHGSIPDAVAATARGAFAYLTKPFDGKLLLDKVAQAARLTSVADAPAGDEHWRASLISRSPRMAELLAEARALGRRVYAERPKAFARRVHRYLELAGA